MLPWWGTTITVYHRLEYKSSGRTVVKWERVIYERCFWGTTIKRVIDGNTALDLSTRIIRMAEWTKGVNVGDIVVKGPVYDDIPDGESGKHILEKYEEAFIVKVAKNNTEGLRDIPHYFGGE